MNYSMDFHKIWHSIYNKSATYINPLRNKTILGLNHPPYENNIFSRFRVDHPLTFLTSIDQLNFFYHCYTWRK